MYEVVETTVMVCQGLVLGIRVRLVHSMVMGSRYRLLWVADSMARKKGISLEILSPQWACTYLFSPSTFIGNLASHPIDNNVKRGCRPTVQGV